MIKKKYCLKYPNKATIEFNTNQERQEYIEQNNINRFGEHIALWEWDIFKKNEKEKEL